MNERKKKLWMGMAKAAAEFSKDKSTKVGSIIVTPDDGFSMGYNGFPRGVNDDIEERHERPTKYLYTSHSELNSITNAARAGLKLKGAILFCTKFPCTECAKAIVQAGVVHIISIPETDPKWLEQQELTLQILKEARVTWEVLDDQQK